MLTRFPKRTTIGLVVIFLITGFIIFSSSAIGQRLNLPSGLAESVWSFLSGNPKLHACDYQDGMIILVKPVATGEGEGRYEAGDIVEIRDGATICQTYGDVDPLGKEERTKLLPLYYPAKLSQEQIQKLTAPEQAGEKMVKRRKSGLDYTKFLNADEILKVRSFEKLDRLPEIDLSALTSKSGEQVSVINESENAKLLVPRSLSVVEKIEKWLLKTAYAATYTKIVDPNNGPGTDYLSLNAWEAGEQGLYSSGDEAIADARRTGALKDTTAFAINGWTAGVIPKIIVNPAYRHEGKWADRRSDGNYVYTLEGYSDSVIFIYVPNITVDGLIIRNTEDRQLRRGIYSLSGGAGNILVSDSIITAVNHASRVFYAIAHENSDASSYMSVRNSVLIGPATIVSGSRGFTALTNGRLDLYNNTVYHFDTGVRTLYMDDLINTVSVGNNADFSGTPGGTVDYNVSSDATAPGTHVATGKTDYTKYFVDPANGDFHLKNTSFNLWGLAGTNLSNVFTTDIDGQARKSDWDVGADEYMGWKVNSAQAAKGSGSLTDGLVGHWTFNNPDIYGTNAYDSSGQNNTGTITGAAKAIGKTGQGLWFDGGDDAVSTASIDLSATDKTTLSFWLNWDTFASDDDLAFEFSANAGSIETGFQIVPNSSTCAGSQFEVALRNQSGGWNNICFTRPSAKKWHHYAFVFDKGAAAANEITPYVDGTAVSYTKDYSVDSTNTFGNHPLFMMSRNASSLFGKGSLDDVRLYNRALSADEIQRLYKMGKVTVKADPLPTPPDYKVASCHLRIANDDLSGSEFRIAIYDSSGTRIGESDTSGIGASFPAWVSASVSNGPTLTPGNTYYISYSANGYLDVLTKGSWSTRKNTRGAWPSTPATINPVSDSGDSMGEFGVYCTNAGGSVLIGNNATAEFTNVSAQSSGTDNVYYELGYMCQTL